MKRIRVLDFIRTLSMLSVIMIHVSSAYVNRYSNYTILGMNLAFILNQACRYAVPAFLFLSGVSLNLTYKKINSFSFLKRQTRKILIPYIIWALVYDYLNHGFTFNEYINSWQQNTFSNVRRIILGQTAPHLYFIFILLQLYLLYPYIQRIMQKHSFVCFFSSFFVTYSIQWLYDLTKINPDIISPVAKSYLWMLFPTWIFYFICGAYFTPNNLEKLQDFCTLYRKPIFFATAVYFIYFLLDAKATQNLDSTKRSLIPYTFLLLFVFFSVWPGIANNPIIRKTSSFLAKHSMTIYFCHVFLLEQIRDHPIFLTGMRGMLLLYLTVLIGSIFIAFICDNLIDQLFRTCVTKTTIPTK